MWGGGGAESFSPCVLVFSKVILSLSKTLFIIIFGSKTLDLKVIYAWGKRGMSPVTSTVIWVIVYIIGSFYHFI